MNSVTYRIVVAALAFTSSALHAQAIGRVSMVEGECELHRASQVMSITLGALISPHDILFTRSDSCLLYTSPSPRDKRQSRMPSSA